MPTILVVEDNYAHRRFIRDVLALEGYDVIEANSGEEALEVLARQAVDLVTLDEAMPGMNGLECYKEIPATIPVVFITVHGKHPDFLALARDPRRRVPILVKPLSHTEITKTVKAELKRKR